MVVSIMFYYLNLYIEAGNSKNTIDYLQYLLADSPDQQLLIFWDSASYHAVLVFFRFCEKSAIISLQFLLQVS